MQTLTLIWLVLGYIGWSLFFMYRLSNEDYAGATKDKYGLRFQYKDIIHGFLGCLLLGPITLFVPIYYEYKHKNKIDSHNRRLSLVKKRPKRE